MINMNASKDGFQKFAVLYSVCSKYEFEANEENTKSLNMYGHTTNVGMPLPSGRWGNALAVALEMHCFNSALYFLENKDELEIMTDKVSSEFGWHNVLGAKEVFEFAMSYYDAVEIEESLEFMAENGYTEFYETAMKKFEKSLDAIEKINALLKADIKVQRKQK